MRQDRLGRPYLALTLRRRPRAGEARWGRYPHPTDHAPEARLWRWAWEEADLSRGAAAGEGVEHSTISSGAG